MSDYTKLTNFTSKDSLPSGNAGKVVKGTEFDSEFNAISTAIATKADKNSPALTGTPTAPTASSGTNTTQLATTAFVTSGFTSGTNTFSGTQAFQDASLQIVGTADTSKKATFDASAITTATIRTLALPDKSGTIALTSDIVAAPTLTTASNVAVSGNYTVSGSTTISFTVTNTFSVGQEVFITFTNTTGSALTAAKYTIVTATSSSFTITYGSSVTSSGTFTAERFGTMAYANAAEVETGTSTLKAITPKLFRDYNLVTRTALTPTGTTAEFTSIPSWVKRITINFFDLSTNAVDPIYLQISSSSTYDTTGYYANCMRIVGTTPGTSNINNGVGFILDAGSGDTTPALRAGSLVLTKVTPNTWAVSGSYIINGVNSQMTLAGTKALSGTLDRVRLIANSGITALFDSGSVNIIYE